MTSPYRAPQVPEAAPKRRVVRRRSLGSILHNFLGSFASRYSDYDGYWIFGFLVRDLGATTLDLCESVADVAGSDPLSTATRRARTVFREQLAKGGVDAAWVTHATLTLARASTEVHGMVNGNVAVGYDVTLTARARSDRSAVYERTTSMFVAPHDALVERRSARGG